MPTDDGFPKYLIYEGGTRKFLSFEETVSVFTSNSGGIMFGSLILKEDLSVHDLKEEAKALILEAVNTCTANN